MYSCFHGPPLDLYCVAAPSSRPCLEHPSGVIIAFMESILSPFVPRYSPPSLIAWFLSCVAHYGLQSHYPLSLMILCQSLPCHSCPLCSKQGKLSIRHFTLPISTIIISVSLSVALLLFSHALVEDLSLPHLWRTSFCRHQLIHSRSQV